MVDEEKHVRLPLFNGDEKEWSAWEEKFSARARRKGYKDVLLGRVAVPKASEVSEANSKIQAKNELAYEVSAPAI